MSPHSTPAANSAEGYLIPSASAVSWDFCVAAALFFRAILTGFAMFSSRLSLLHGSTATTLAQNRIGKVMGRLKNILGQPPATSVRVRNW
jgi:hypothetical protein